VELLGDDVDERAQLDAVGGKSIRIGWLAGVVAATAPRAVPPPLVPLEH